MYNPSTRQFKVCLYDSETQSRRSMRFNKDNYDNDDACIAHVREVQRENRLKNARYKRDKTKAMVMETQCMNRVNDPMANVIFVTGVDLDIDKGTGSSIVIFGASKRGKTTLMMYLYDKYFTNKKKINTLFSGNPQLKIYDNDPNLIVGYGFNQQSAKYIKLQQYINVKTKNQYEFTDLFDDIIDQKYSKTLNNLVLTYRNSNITSIMCLQYVCMLSKQNRSSVNHTFVFGANSGEDVEVILKLILKPYLVELGLCHYNEMMQFYHEVTRDHGFIYINNIKNTMTCHRLDI